MKQKNNLPACASCNVELSQRICSNADGRGGKGCPTLTKQDIISEANKEYQDNSIRKFAQNASIQEAECYANRDQKPYIMQPTKTRIVEICEFAQRMGYKRLGLAFCRGLVKEAAAVEDILKRWGFEVVSSVCKAGRTPKEFLGLNDDQKIYRGKDESMCNPILQAKILNSEHTEFNIVLGLCVGHDSMFFKFAEAPTTVLAAKDRVTGHNPLAAIYLADSYYAKVKIP